VPGTVHADADRRRLERVSAFSDGVFAIAITLLVLNLEVPDVSPADLGGALSDLSGDLVAYAIGFAVIGLFWFSHHGLFSRLAVSDGRLVLVNMVLLGFIALMPFTTGLLGRYSEPEVVALYAANVGLATLLDGLLRVVAVRDGLGADASLRLDRADLVSTGVQALIFFASIPIAYLVSTSLAQWSWALLIVSAAVRRARGRAAPPGR
jgi:uncharacterized membrane protein